jgi:hypothetical protein
MHMHAPTTETVSWSSGLTRSLVWPRGGSHRDRATRVSIDFMSSIRPTRPAGREVLPDDLLRFAHREPAVKRRRFTPSNHAISSMVSSPDSRKARAASFSGDIMVGRPPNPPASPRCLKPGTSPFKHRRPLKLSQRREDMQRQTPAAVVVSRPSVNDRNPASGCSRSPIVSISHRSDRPNRSTRQTTSVSPAPRSLRAGGAQRSRLTAAYPRQAPAVSWPSAQDAPMVRSGSQGQTGA